jgi:uncharacterized OsmC-like protein
MARMTVRHRIGDAFDIDIRGHSLRVDQRSPNDDEYGPTPVELFVGSLAACAAHYAHRYLRDTDRPHHGLAVECDWLMRAGTPHAVGSVRLRVVTPAALPEHARRELLAAIDACTVQNSIRPPLPAVSVELDDGSGDAPLIAEKTLHHAANAI